MKKCVFMSVLRVSVAFGLLGTLCLNGVGHESEQESQPAASSSAPTSSLLGPSISDPVEIDFDAFNFDPEQLPLAKRRCTDDRKSLKVSGSLSQEQQNRQRKISQLLRAEGEKCEQDALKDASEKLQKSWEEIWQSPLEEIQKDSYFRPDLLVSAYRLLYEAVQANNNLSAEGCRTQLVETLNAQHKDELLKMREGDNPSTQMKSLRYTFHQLLPAIAEQLPRACLKGMKLSLLKRGEGGFKIEFFDEKVNVANRTHLAARADRAQHEQDVLTGASEQLKASWETVKASVKQEYTSKGQFKPDLLAEAYSDLYKAVEADDNLSAEQCQSFLMDKLNTQHERELRESTDNGKLSTEIKSLRHTFSCLLSEMAKQLLQAGLGEMKLSISRKGGDGFKCTLLREGETNKRTPAEEATLVSY